MASYDGDQPPFLLMARMRQITSPTMTTIAITTTRGHMKSMPENVINCDWLHSPALPARSMAFTRQY